MSPSSPPSSSARPPAATDGDAHHHRGTAVDGSLHVGRHLRGLRPRDAGAVPWGSPTVRVVLASTLLAPLGVALISPGLPVIQARFGLTDARASLVISTYFLAGIVLSPVVGLVEDRYGRRRVLVPSLVGFGLAGAAIAVVPSYGAVLALRVLQGAAATGIFVTTVTVIGDSFDGVQRSAVLGANTAVLSAGAAAFPVVGGLLAARAWNGPFVLYLLGLPVAWFAHRALAEPAVVREARGPGSFRQVLVALSAREAALLYGSAFAIELLLFGAVFTAVPFLLAETYGATPVGIGLVVTAALVASAVAASQSGRLSRHVSDDALIVLGFGSAGAGLVGAWLAASPAAIGAASAVFGAGWGLTLPAIDDRVSEFVPDGLRAEALSLRNSTTFLGRAVAPVAVTALAVSWSYPALLLAAGVAGFAAGLLGWALSLPPAGS